MTDLNSVVFCFQRQQVSDNHIYVHAHWKANGPTEPVAVTLTNPIHTHTHTNQYYLHQRICDLVIDLLSGMAYIISPIKCELFERLFRGSGFLNETLTVTAVNRDHHLTVHGLLSLVQRSTSDDHLHGFRSHLDG